MQKPTLEVVQQHSPCLAFCMLVWFLFACTTVQAADTLVLLSSKSDAYQEVADVIISNTPDRQLDQQDLEQIIKQPEALNAYPLIIAIGTAASEYAFRFSAENSSLLSTFIPAVRYQELYAQHQDRLERLSIRSSAVFLDQPISRQLRLAQLIKPDLETVGFTLGQDSAPKLVELHSQASAMGIRLNYSSLSETDNPIQRIQPIIQNNDLFLVLPDKNTFNKTTAKWLLYMSFRNQVPLIAFSQNYVNAGAIAACISTPRDIGRFTAEQIRLINDRYIPPAQYSPYFRVVTNPRSARKLEITIQAAETLQQQLLEAE